jgi:hypothetical protein
MLCIHLLNVEASLALHLLTAILVVAVFAFAEFRVELISEVQLGIFGYWKDLLLWPHGRHFSWLSV